MNLSEHCSTSSKNKHFMKSKQNCVFQFAKHMVFNTAKLVKCLKTRLPLYTCMPGFLLIKVLGIINTEYC